MPSSSWSSAATRRAMSSASSFSWRPPGPTAPASWPPCPGSITIVWRGSGPGLPGGGAEAWSACAVEVDDDARGILQAKDLPRGRRALEGHAERGGAASLAELGGRHQPVPDRPGARPAAGAHVGERDRQPAALGLDEPGLDRRIRLEDHPRVGGVRADAKLDAGRGPGRRARQGGRGRIRLGPRRRGRARYHRGRRGGSAEGAAAGISGAGGATAGTATGRGGAATAGCTVGVAPPGGMPRASRTSVTRTPRADERGQRPREQIARHAPGALAHAHRRGQRHRLPVDRDASRVPGHLDDAVTADQAHPVAAGPAPGARARQAGDVGQEIVGRGSLRLADQASEAHAGRGADLDGHGAGAAPAGRARRSPSTQNGTSHLRIGELSF